MREFSSSLGLASLLIATLAATSPPATAAAVAQEPDLALRGVTVVDVSDGTLVSDRTVLVEDGRIAAIGPSEEVAIPEGADVVDAAGKYVIPGLWDMHSHTWDAESTRSVVFPLEVANGVVGIRNMAGDCHGDAGACSDRARVEEIESLEREVAEGRLLGPEIHNGSTFLDGPHSIKDESVVLTSERKAREVVREHARRGFDFLKVYDYLTPEVYHALADEAERQGISFAGHVPWTIGVGEAAEAGQKSMEHGFGWFKAASGMEEELVRERREALEADKFTLEDRFALLYDREGSQYPRMVAREGDGLAFRLSDSALQELADVLGENRTWQAPTLTMNGRMILVDDLLEGDVMRYLPPGKRRAWSEVLADAEEMEPSVRAFHQAAFEALLRIVGELHDAGVEFLAGTDCDVDLIAPGFHLHQELELFVRAGLTPAEALRTATVNAARYLGRESEMGMVEEGKTADLVLLGGNPLEDIRNTQRIEAVVLDGRLLDREELDEILEGVERYAGGSEGPEVAGRAGDAAAREPTLVVENGRVVVGDGTVLERGNVIVAGDRIVSITEGTVEAPDARRIDASGRTVLPGLIDAHVHLTIGPGVPDSASLAAFLAERVSEVLQEFLRHGVTTVRSTGDYWPEVGRLRDRVAAGDIEGPRILTAGPVLTAEGAHPAVTVCPPDNTFCRTGLARELASPEEGRDAVRRLAAEGVDFAKLVSDSLLAPVQISDQLLSAIVDQAHREGLEAVGHVAEAGFMESAAVAGLDGFVHPTMNAIDEERTRELAKVLVEHDTPVTTTLSAALVYGGAPVTEVLEAVSEGREGIESQAREVALLAEEGVRIVVGTDWCPCGPAVAEDPDPAVRAGAVTVTEMEMLTWGGLSEEAILAAATREAARALGLSSDLGTLEPGKLADLIVVDGDPLEDLSALRNVEVVLKGGAVVVEGERREASIRREEVTFESAGLRLAGTLTLPEGPGPHAGVVMIPGGGPRAYDRDYTRPGGFQPFRLLADHLAEEGVASLRYDERGVGGSEGESSRDVTSADYADDARAALAHLRSRAETDGGRVGLVGHSEGAHIASVIASSSDSVDFLVLLGAVALLPDRASLEQMERLTRRGGWGNGDESWVARRLELERRSLEAGDAVTRWEELEADWRTYYRELQEVLVPEASVGWLRETSARELAENTASFTRSGWVQHWMASDPPSLLRGLAVPVLALYGGLDLQVPADLHAGPMWKALQEAAAEPVRVHTLPRANHFFRPAETGALHEVADLEPTFVPNFLALVTDWIRERI